MNDNSKNDLLPAAQLTQIEVADDMVDPKTPHDLDVADLEDARNEQQQIKLVE